MKKSKVLYVSYNGMLEPLGASQVLSYLYQLSAEYDYHLISLEKPIDLKDKNAFKSLQAKLRDKNIKWSPISYHLTKVGKLINFLKFATIIFKVLFKEKIKYVHVRSYTSAIPIYLIKKILPIKYIFDTRGFAFDERMDIGAIKRGSISHKILKWIEVKLYKNASGINMLSLLGKQTIIDDELFLGGSKLKNISIIPTCVDLERFKFINRTYNDPLTIGYIGTAIGWYDFEKTAKTFRRILDQRNVKFLIFNGGQHEFIKDKLISNKIPVSSFQIEKVSFHDMPERLKDIDIALFFIHPYFSKRASAATKLGELLASGIPVMTNKDVGDHEYYIKEYKTGEIIDFNKLDSYDFNRILTSLTTKETATNCRKTAEKYFSLDNGVKKYKELYNRSFFV